MTITVLDNLSTDQSKAWIQQNYPEVSFVSAKENRVLCSYNDYLATIQEPVAILLNNDIKVDPGFIDPLIKYFESDPRCFLVAPQVKSFDGSWVEAGASHSGVRWGLFWCNARYPNYESNVLTPSSTDSSGFGAFSRDLFLKLGGYDVRYLPGIMEDVDLCLNAKKAGYHLFYEPKSVVYHMGQATFKKTFGSEGISRLAHRNNFLFMWKNFKGLGFWISHLFFLPLRLIWAALRGNTGMILGFFDALKTKK